MEKECKYIELVFENCETAIIKGSDIDFCEIEGIKTKIVKYSHSAASPFHESKTCESFMLRLPIKAERGRVKFPHERENEGSSPFSEIEGLQ